MSARIATKPGWLSSILVDKRSRIAALFAELAGLGAPASMKPGKFRRFLELLAQIDSEEEKERETLLEIEQIELKHRFARDHHKLEQGDKAYMPCDDDQPKGLWHTVRGWLHSDAKDICH